VVDNLEEYTVRVKDYEQDITHVVKVWASSLNEANAKALEELRALLGYDDLEVV
jgi:hypothetical protein